MTHITPEEILDTLANRQRVYGPNAYIQLDYWRMVCPEFTEDEVLDLMETGKNATAIICNVYLPQVPLNDAVIATGLDNFIKGVEFGRELERKANARI